MGNSGQLRFERKSFNEEIEVWLDTGDGSPASTKALVAVITFQSVLRNCRALDEGTINMFSAMELNTPGVRVENVDCVLKKLGITRAA
jgi:hypothetical protein